MNVKSRIGQLVGESINAYNNKLKPIIEEVELREKYQSRIIECMIGEVDDNYIETPEVTESVFKLEYSKEGLVKLPTIKGKTILVDADGNETSTPGEGCRLMSVGEKEDNKLIISSKNKNFINLNKFINPSSKVTNFEVDGKTGRVSIVTNNGSYPFIKYEVEHNILDLFRNKKIIIKYSVSQKPTNARPTIQAFGRSISRPDGFWITNNMIVPNDITSLSFQIYGNNTNDLEIIGTTVYENVFIGIEDAVFTPHQSYKAEILLDEPLRSLPNGVCDEIIGNQLIRRVGVMIFKDGNLFGAFQNYDLTYKYGMGISHDIIGSTTLIADTIPYKQKLTIEEESTETQVCIYHHTLQKEIRISFLKSDYPQITNNKETFVEYLKNNPLTIYYELAEPIIEELPNSIALQCFDDTTMYIENSITPMVTYGYNALIPYKEELAKQREEVDNNVLDIETNIIPYLTEIEYNLNRMEGN